MFELPIKAPGTAEPKCFETTHWSVVLAAGETGSVQVTESLERLCRTYWRPLYAFVRRKGYTPADAEDLTQGFFAHLLEKEHLQNAGPEKGKFRTFLLCSLNHFLANDWNKARCLKRGGGKPLLPLEIAEDDPFFESGAATLEGPEAAYDRRWACALLATVLRRLRDEFKQSGRESRFLAFKPFLMGEPDCDQYLSVAGRLNMSEQAVKSAIFRFRRRFKELFREEVSHTVATRAQIDEELRYLVRLMTA